MLMVSSNNRRPINRANEFVCVAKKIDGELLVIKLLVRHTLTDRFTTEATGLKLLLTTFSEVSG